MTETHTKSESAKFNTSEMSNSTRTSVVVYVEIMTESGILS